MDVLILTLFASAMLGLLALLFFAWTVRTRSHEHIERLALLPLDEEHACSPSTLETLDHANASD